MTREPPKEANKAAVHGRTLRTVLKRLRRRRGLTTADMAEALEIDVRTYERLAAGRTRLDLSRVFALADILSADPLGFVAALRLNDPNLVEATAEAKVLTALALALGQLTARERERLSQTTAIDMAEACARFIADLVGASSAPEP